MAHFLVMWVRVRVRRPFPRERAGLFARFFIKNKKYRISNTQAICNYS
jgi:hypothetical protein